MDWKVYLLECADGSYYCGICTDMERRLAEHNGDLPGGARYTRTRRPVRVLAWAPCADRSEASRAEWRIKRLKKRQKQAYVELLAKDSPPTEQ